MYNGTDSPKIVVGGVTTTLSQVVKGGRKQEYEDLTTTWENVNGEIFTDSPKFRFKGEYSFKNVSDSLVRTLLAYKNGRQAFNFYPHSDSWINHSCILSSVKYTPQSGYTNGTQLTIEVVARNTIASIPDHVTHCTFSQNVFIG